MINPDSTFCEVDFRKSSFSDPNMQCVTVARRGSWVAIRDSKTSFDTAEDCRLVVSAEPFEAFIAQFRR